MKRSEAYDILVGHIQTFRKRSEKYREEAESEQDFNEGEKHARVSSVLKELERLALSMISDQKKIIVRKNGNWLTVAATITLRSGEVREIPGFVGGTKEEAIRFPDIETAKAGVQYNEHFQTGEEFIEVDE